MKSNLRGFGLLFLAIAMAMTLTGHFTGHYDMELKAVPALLAGLFLVVRHGG